MRETGAEAVAVHCDIAGAAAVVQAAQQVQVQLGLASVLVNNAGMLRATPLAEVYIGQWNEVLAVNPTGRVPASTELACADRSQRKRQYARPALLATGQLNLP